MGYKYKPIEEAVEGDVVECIKTYSGCYTKGKFYIVGGRYFNTDISGIATVNSDRGEDANNGHNFEYFKLLETKLGKCAVKGDECVLIINLVGRFSIGSKWIQSETHDKYLFPEGTNNSLGLSGLRVLCKISDELDIKSIYEKEF